MTKKIRMCMNRKREYAGIWLSANYTVEASWIMAISMGILLFAILCGYELFEETL